MNNPAEVLRPRLSGESIFLLRFRVLASPRRALNGRYSLILASRVDPERAQLLNLTDGPAVRRDIARAVPFYAGIEDLRGAGDQVQWGGPRLCEGGRTALPRWPVPLSCCAASRAQHS